MSTNYLIEFQSIGTLVRVTALDPQTGLEAVIQGPASAGQQALGRLAVQKLEYVLRKKHGESGGR